MTMPSFATVEQAGTGASSPSTSTMQIRHEEMALRSFKKQSVGMWEPAFSAASRIVAPLGTDNETPSTMSEIACSSATTEELAHSLDILEPPINLAASTKAIATQAASALLFRFLQAHTILNS